MKPSQEIEALVHDIRDLLSQTDAADTDRVSELAERYNEACKSINKRLAVATVLLRQGFISEMQHAVETYPDALDSAGQLELGDKRDSWLKLCEINGMAVIGPRTELSTELVRCYPEHDKLVPLIRAHRVLAISCGSLRDRISVLRRLVALDGLNPSWKAQLIALEAARDEQIENEVRQSAALSDEDALEKLLGEMRDAGRKSPAPTPLIELTIRCRENVRRRLAMKRRNSIAALVHDFRSQSDWKQCCDLIREYDTLGAIPGVQTPDDITSAIESVREWAESNRAVFEHNKEFLKACETLERMMDEGSDFRELERHFALIQRAELPVPKTIEQRFLQKRRQESLERTRRYRIYAVITCGAVIISTFMIVRVMNQRALDSKIETWIAGMEQVLDNSDFDAASKLAEQVRANEPDVVAAPRVVTLLERADQEIKQEKLRRERFAQALNDMKNLIGIEYEVPAAIARAKGLARVDTELMDFSEERDRLMKARNSDQESRDAPFRQARKDISTSVANASALPGPAQALALRDAAQRFDELLRMKGISDAELKITRSERDAALAQAVTIEQAAERQRELAEQLERLPAAATSVPILIASYESLISRFPETAPAKKLNDVLAHRGAWSLIDSMNIMKRNWSESIIPKTKEDCIGRVIEIEVLLAKITNSPDQAILEDYLNLIKHFASLDSGPREALRIDAVRQMLESAWVSDLQFARDDTGRIFYTRHGVTKQIPGGFYTLTNHVSKLEHLIDDSPSTANAIMRSETEPVLTDAPINALGDQLLDIISSIDDSNVDSIHLQIARTIAQDRKTDPILRLILISDVLDHHIKSGRPSNPTVTRFAREASNISYQGQKVIDMNWTDTSGDVTKRGRELAESVLERVPDFDSVIADWTARRANLARTLGGFIPVGVFWPDDSGTTIVRFVRPPIPGKFFIVTGNDEAASFSEAGSIDANGVAVPTLAPDPGTPVFMRQVQQP